VTASLDLNFPNPVHDPSQLFDRVTELASVKDAIRSAGTRTVVIMGERRVGKTSLLNVVLAWAEMEDWLSVLRLPHVTSRTEFIEEILDGMAAEAGTSLAQLDRRSASDHGPSSSVSEFVRIAGELGAATGRTFLVCLDELDSMLHNCSGPSANELMNLILHLESVPLPLRFLFTMTRATPQILHADASPFITAARIVRLGLWSPEEAGDFFAILVNGAHRLDQAAHERLYAAAGGHPYFLKAITKCLMDAPPESSPVPVAAIDRAVGAALAMDEVNFTLENIVTAHFSPDELAVLNAVAAARGPMPTATLERRPVAVSELVRRQYLRRDGNGYVLTLGLLGQWLASRPSSSPRQLPDMPDHTRPTLVVDAAAGRVFLGENELHLTPQEFRFLRCVVARAGMVVDRASVAEQVWPDEIAFDGGRDNRLDALVHRLRDALGADHARYFQTRRGHGYIAHPEHVELIPEGGHGDR